MLGQSINTLLTATQTTYNSFDDFNVSSSSYSWYSSSSGENCMPTALISHYIVPYSEKVVRLGILPIIVIVGLTLNLWFLLAVARVPFMKSPLNCYLVNLACADILILATNTVDKVIQYIVAPVQNAAAFGVEGCVLITVFKWWGFFTSLTLISIITFEKFYAVCHPLTHKRLNHKKRTLILCVASWVGAFLAACVEIPTEMKMETRCVSQVAPGDEFDWFPRIIHRCHPINVRYVKFCQVYTSIPFFIGMIFNLYLYIRIYLAVRRTTGWHQQATRSDHADPGANRAGNQYRVARMLIINGLVYFICLAPNQIILLVDAFDAAPIHTEFKHYGTIIQLAAVMIYLNSCMNPIVYCLTNPRYRLAYRMTCKCGCTKYRRGFGETTNGVNSADYSRTRSTSLSMNHLSVKWNPDMVATNK